MKILKRKTVAHYNKMIKWAETQNPRNLIDKNLMLREINECWDADHCPYCKYYSESSINHEYGDCQCFLNEKLCPLFRLNKDEEWCCHGLWAKMHYSKTWGTWIKNAIKVRDYIEENG